MDYTVSHHGSVCILTPITDAAREWCDEHLPEDAMRWGPHGYVIEPRYLGAIIEGLEEAGLSSGSE